MDCFSILRKFSFKLGLSAREYYRHMTMLRNWFLGARQWQGPPLIACYVVNVTNVSLAEYGDAGEFQISSFLIKYINH